MSTKMFDKVDETWNAWSGCEHGCIYCWARDLAETKLAHVPRYQSGFRPRLNESEFRKSFKPGTFVFVCDMGDLFGAWVPSEAIQRVIDHVAKFPETTFLFLTKNPARYDEFEFPQNCILGATIETNCSEHTVACSSAPLPLERYEAMLPLGFEIQVRTPEGDFETACEKQRLMLAIEPIMDFDFEVMVGWVEQIKPEFVYVGYDNWGHNLPEPPLEKTMSLIERLESHTEVRTKTLRESVQVMSL